MQLQQNRVINYNFVYYNYNFSKPARHIDTIKKQLVVLYRAGQRCFGGRNDFPGVDHEGRQTFWLLFCVYLCQFFKETVSHLEKLVGDR